MGKARRKTRPRTFFLNEQHELRRGEKEGGGRPPKYAPIDWAVKGRTIHDSLNRVKQVIMKSKDPLRGKRYFFLANPEAHVVKKSESRNRPPRYEEKTEYSKGDSQVFQRLGLDLLQVNDDGTAGVHAKSDQMERLVATSERLDTFGQREKFRWMKIQKFEVIPSKYRVDSLWLENLKRSERIDAVIELQPLLENREIDTVLHTITELLKQEDGGKLHAAGKDFSGRHWYRGIISRKCIEGIANYFYSVQSLHTPLVSRVASEKIHIGENIEGTPAIIPQSSSMPTGRLPCVAVVDTGTPSDHLRLSSYRRGQYVDPGASGMHTDHGSFVASRIVFGDRSYDELTRLPQGDCAYYDATIASDGHNIDEKSIFDALNAIVRTSPDVRVFNFSFDGTQSLGNMEIAKKEKLRAVGDLDNFIFAHDIIVAVAAGNSPPGIPPHQQYPNHINDPQWLLAHWARSFNSITCGSYVEIASVGNGLVRNAYWPSPFTRMGPGFCKSPKPDFSAHGGNLRSDYQWTSGLGVWGINYRGIPEDRSGTSHSVPLLAREAAFALDVLNNYCSQGAKPYGVTAKAFLALTAIPPTRDREVKELVGVTLGKGTAIHRRIANPRANSAVFVWQGLLENSKDKARIRIPIPNQWLQNAKKPYLRLVLAWDTPVNSEVVDIWACRKVDAQFRPGPDRRALHPKGHSHISYPLIERRYDLRKIPGDTGVQGDDWLLEISYKEIAAYYSNIEFAPQQRVAFAGELIDFGERPVSPQAYIQALPIASTMQTLSVPPAILRSPVIIKSRV